MYIYFNIDNGHENILQIFLIFYLINNNYLSKVHYKNIHLKLLFTFQLVQLLVHLLV